MRGLAYRGRPAASAGHARSGAAGIHGAAHGGGGLPPVRPVVPVWATRATAAHMMVALGIDAVIVLEDDRIHGIVTTSDLAASLVEHGSAAGASATEQQPPAAEGPPEIGT
jgi:hypothetical protein